MCGDDVRARAMNEFLSQFLIESREFVEQASEGLLRLERAPADTELLDGVFRAFHTLKGGAGIVDFDAMERAVHAAEDVLSDARAHRASLTSARISECLKCLDQVVIWLDTIERTGELPAQVEAAANEVIRGLASVSGAPATEATKGSSARDWLAELIARNPVAAASAVSALRFAPNADCFYQGGDPLARMTALPGLLALELQLPGNPTLLNTFDPYRCILSFTALTAAAPEVLHQVLAEALGDVDVVPLSASMPAPRNSTLSAFARKLLEAQLALLTGGDAEHFNGRIGSVGRTAENVLRYCALESQAALISQATQRSLVERVIEPLRDAIEHIVGGVEQPMAPSQVEPARRAESATRTLRVDAGRIDALVRLTSELTVAKNGFGHLLKVARTQGNDIAGALKERHGVLEHLVSELQSQVLGMRVLPLRSVLQRFPRLVRETSLSLGKSVQLDIEGDDTEADKAIVEMLFEPLLHIVRNAIDHGIETPDKRSQSGKPAVATLQIRAARQADRVFIQVTDDGKGVDVQRVREVARQRGVATHEQLSAMTEAEVAELIFAPGFSTATALSEISGRGVGLDVVRAAVARVGGRVTLDNRPAQGTTFEISLPFSVMMTRVMTVECGEQIFGIPLDAIVETIRVPIGSLARVGAAQAIVLRERTIPLLPLGQSLGVSQATSQTGLATIVITATAGHWAGLQVDRLGEQLEVILQPLEGLLSGTPGIAGTTLLGDGRVLLVLDIGALLL